MLRIIDGTICTRAAALKNNGTYVSETVCGSSYIHNGACVQLWSLEDEPIQRQMLFLFSV